MLVDLNQSINISDFMSYSLKAWNVLLGEGSRALSHAPLINEIRKIAFGIKCS